MSEFILGDCIEGMKRFPDKYFDLAIVDPPYGGGAKEPDANGIGGVEQTSNSAEQADSENGLRTTISAMRTGGTWSQKYQGGSAGDKGKPDGRQGLPNGAIRNRGYL